MNTLIELAYLVAAVCFILGLKQLSSPKGARNGNRIAAVGMVIAIVATLPKLHFTTTGVISMMATELSLKLRHSITAGGTR